MLMFLQVVLIRGFPTFSRKNASTPFQEVDARGTPWDKEGEAQREPNWRHEGANSVSTVVPSEHACISRF